MSKKINGMSASIYKLMYYPPDQSEWDSKTSKSFFDSMKQKEAPIAKTEQRGNRVSVAGFARSKGKTDGRSV
jgi:hypothetical protein